MISQTTEYALRAVVWLAAQRDHGELTDVTHADMRVVELAQPSRSKKTPNDQKPEADRAAGARRRKNDAARTGKSSSDARTVEHIAAATHVPSGYLAKVLHTLAKADVVRSQRGLGGGFALARHSSEITVLDIVNAVDPFRRIKQCPLGVLTHMGGLCPLHRRLDDAMAMVEQALRECTIESLVYSTQSNRPLCARPDGAGADG